MTQIAMRFPKIRRVNLSSFCRKSQTACSPFFPPQQKKKKKKKKEPKHIFFVLLPPSISFRAIQEVFNKHAGDQKWIPKSAVKPILIELGAKPEELTDEIINEIIKTSNLDGDEKIEFKEFLIACAVGLFLKNSGENQSPQFQEIREGFLVVRQAFDKIDEDKSEEIDFEELRGAFLSMKQDDLINERLKELDFNGDKTIEFPEFVYGMCAWVGMGGSDEDEIVDPEVLSPQLNNKFFDLKDELEHGHMAIES
ncbi:hypothetical protein RFI_25996 [Reticulomyxa filosa]|uniref:EF-hand domain-containing protein n=1 Tax=Reticulomyxa filosa TaxID=46433 RepID=X6MC19_RETFI|nr:hypothetical protein RFI_25996 [Reticulomyxa filosa]|eukprot:ETO11379.1 hypothetical protein RFI_25996 [Reticulomyxa filosa]